MYEIYKSTKRLMEKPFCKEHEDDRHKLQVALKYFEKENPHLKARYDREKEIINSFTQEQIDHICYQIGEWYLSMKPLLERQHNLGHAKEVLKLMICGEEKNYDVR